MTPDTQLAERRQACRALLRQPLLPAGDPAFSVVRRHHAWLAEWFSRHPRWSLQVSAEFARLRKTPGDPSNATHPAVDPKSGTAFTRRRYVLFCLLLAALERSERQTTLGRLREGISTQLVAAGIAPLDLASQGERRDMVHTLRLLAELGALRRVAGDEDRFVHDAHGDALYNVAPRVVGALLDVRTPPSLVSAVTTLERLHSATSEPAPDTEGARLLAIRTRLFRLLLDEPVVLYATLSPDERSYFAKQRPHIVEAVIEATGLVEEARLEGIAMVDPEGTLSDVFMPEEGSEGHCTLLVAEWLAQRPGGSTLSAVEGLVRKLADEHQTRWRKDTREPGAEARLARGALSRLEALGLVNITPDGVRALPTLSRYRVRKPASKGLFAAKEEASS